MTTYANTWRFDLAKRIAEAYAENPKTEVVMVAGSVGRGTADAFSDVEIDVYYSSAPTEDERVAAVRRCGADLKLLDQDEVEWEEQMEFSGFPAATSTFLISTMERFLHRVIDCCDPDAEAQLRLYSVQHSVPIVGEELANEWRRRAKSYPDGLVSVMLEENLRFGALFRNVEMHLARNDLLGFYDAILDAEKRIVRGLLGLNRIYLPTPEPIKRLDEVVDAMDLKPGHLSSRLKGILRDEPRDGVRKLEDLILEVFELVTQNHGDFDVDVSSRGLVRVRRAWDTPPILS